MVWMEELVLWFLVGYLFGSFPTGYVISRLLGKDVRKYGSGNIGGANVYRVLGFWPAFFTALGDVLKGFLPVFLSPGGMLAVSAGIGALSGAIFSLFLGFKGGKGFGALVGVFLGLLLFFPHWELLIALTLVWITTLWLSSYTSLANLITICTALPMSAMVGSPQLLAFFTAAVVLICYSHRENVERLLKGEEKSYRKRVKTERW
jgi:glycerol-3-phosphate acyltransferase PlsY